MLEPFVRKRRGRPYGRARTKVNMLPGLLELEDRALMAVVAGPTNLEQYMLQLINRARSDPAAEAQRLHQLAGSDPAVRGMAGADDLAAFQREIARYGALPPLAFDLGLVEAARDQSARMLATNDQRHSPAGYLTNPNVARADDGGAYYPVGSGAWATGENIYAYTGNVASNDWKNHVEYLHAGLMIDWGNPNFGHLKNLLAPGPGGAKATSWPFRSIGIGILTNVRPTVPPPSNPDLPANRGLNVGPAIVTQEFGWRSGPAVLTGVVYHDADGDQFYTPGEGLGAVAITAAGLNGQGTYTVQTWASGGYSLELPAGSYTVTASGGGLPGPRGTVITIGIDNVGWDVVDDPAARADTPVPADYDGDGQVELAAFDASNAVWVIEGRPPSVRASLTGGGDAGIPVPADYDGDGRVDQAVFYPRSAQWSIALSTGGTRVLQFGLADHDLPVPADYDGDGKADLAVFRPSTATWHLLQSTDGLRSRQFGMADHDLPIPADYDGDGKVDLAVYRPSSAHWFVLRSSDGPWSRQFGMADHDLPIPADYDGDGKVDLAVYRPSSAHWFVLQSSDGPWSRQFGMADHDLPIPADYDGDGKADLAVFRPSTAQWFRVQTRLGPSVTTLGAPGQSRLPTLTLAPSADGYARLAALSRPTLASSSQFAPTATGRGGVSAPVAATWTTPLIPTPEAEVGVSHPFRTARTRWATG